MTTVVNINHTSDYDVYIGRPSRFGNPYVISRRVTREQAIEGYRASFALRVANDPEFRASVERLRGKVLGCYCKPAACHGDVIVEWLQANTDNKSEGGEKGVSPPPLPSGGCTGASEPPE